MSGDFVEVRPEIAEIARFIDEQADITPFGTVTVTVALHGGRIARTQRSTTVHHKPIRRRGTKVATAKNEEARGS